MINLLQSYSFFGKRANIKAKNCFLYGKGFNDIADWNVLNNTVALQRIQEALEIEALEFQGVYYVTKQMAADYYGVELRTIENCLADNDEELRHNGYHLWKGNSLKGFKLQFGKEIDFPTKTTVLGIFDFRSFLNIGMLLTTSDKAKQVRSLMLDIVISIINEKPQNSFGFFLAYSYL